MAEAVSSLAAMFESSFKLAVGNEGSKNPCECCLGRCFCSSRGGASGDPFLAIPGSCGMYTAEGRLKLGSDVLLLAFELCCWAAAATAAVLDAKFGSCEVEVKVGS